MAERTRFYRDKREGKILGVCAGIADYTGIDVLIVRIAVIVLAISPASFITIACYFILGCLAPIKPAALYDDRPEEKEFWQNIRTKPTATMHDVKMRFSEMERKLRDMEAYVTSRRRDLDREFDKLKDA